MKFRINVRRLIALVLIMLVYTAIGLALPTRQERVEEIKQRIEVIEPDPAPIVEEPVEPSVPVPTEPDDSYYEENENALIEQALLAQATVLEDCKITYYCCEKYPHICNAGPPYLTYLETEPTPWVTCAVDPRVIPLGSDVLIDFGDGDILYLVAEDIGGAIKGNKIDINVATHQEALELGVDRATVYYIPPEVNCNG